MIKDFFKKIWLTIKYLGRKIKHVLIFILVLFYVILEEILWVQIAKRIFNYLKNLHLYQKFLLYIEYKASKELVLFTFLIFFIIAEIVGILAVAVIPILPPVSILFSVILYTIKAVFIAIPFSILNVAKDKLMSFKFFEIIYNIVIKFNIYLEQYETYITIKQLPKKLKKYLKNRVIKIKNVIKDINSYIEKELEIDSNRSRLKIISIYIYRKLKSYIKRKTDVTN